MKIRENKYIVYLEEPYKLNVGCGDKKIYGFVNIDAREECNPDVVCDLLNINHYFKNSCGLVYACHVLEHFKPKQHSDLLKCWRDCLIDGGKIRISVPDFDSIIKYYLSTKDIYKIQTLLHGGLKYPLDVHYVSFNFSYLSNLLYNTGFTEVKFYDWKTTEHKHIDDYSQAYLPHMDKINGMQMSLNIEAIKV